LALLGVLPRRDVVELLLKMQASANIPDLRGCFPLHLAAWRGNADICQILLCRGPSFAKVNAQVKQIVLLLKLNGISNVRGQDIDGDMADLRAAPFLSHIVYASSCQ